MIDPSNSSTVAFDDFNTLGDNLYKKLAQFMKFYKFRADTAAAGDFPALAHYRVQIPLGFLAYPLLDSFPDYLVYLGDS